MDTFKLNLGAMMASDWDKTTPNIRVPRDEPDTDYGSTVVGYRFQEEEAPRQKTPPQQQPPQKSGGGGIPGWVWGILAGFGGLVFLIMAGVLLWYFWSSQPGFKLIIEGAEPNSRIFIDGTERSTTSSKGTYVVHDLRAGRRNIRVVCDGFADYNGSVVGRDGGEEKIQVSMTKSGSGNNGGPKPSPKPPCPNPPCPTDPNCDPECFINGKCDIECQMGKTGKVNLTVNFASGKADILPVSFVSLDNVAAVLRKRTEWKIRVEGHTDNKGNVTYNLNLSKLRAASVMKYFADRGVDPTRMTSEGFGKSQPIAGTVENQTEDQRTLNRRVTIVKTN